jgi:hypothetical protein
MSRTNALVWTAAVLATLLAGRTHASVIWDGNASRGLDVFGNLNCDSPGSVTAVNDATHGTVWRYNKPSGSNRCENHGIKVGGTRYVFAEGRTYFLGWRSRISSTANNNANFQWKSYGQHIQNYPVLLKMIGGKMSLMYRAPGEACCRTLWARTISANAWNDYVLSLKLSSVASTGYIEFWFNGQMQTLSNGLTRYPGRTLDDINEPKWGIYGQTDISSSNHVHALKVGTTYADVAPGGPGGGEVQKIPVPGSAVSASTHDGNVPANTVDGNLGTRWSALGDPQWIQFDLGSTKLVSEVRIAWYKGDARNGIFDVQVSDSPTGPWTTALSGRQSSGSSLALERYTFGEQGGRYVRIVGHGNTANDWNSLTEVEIWGRD